MLKPDKLPFDPSVSCSNLIIAHTIWTVAKKNAFSKPIFIGLCENWPIKSFFQKIKHMNFLFGPKKLTKNYKVTNLSVCHDFCIILYLITQRVFIVKTSVWVRWKGILLIKIQKIKNPTTIICKKYLYMTHIISKPFT
jgi:hypothetical protein